MGAAPGTRLGPYEIVKPLGAGGMGDVYEALDTRLGRTVAVKLLSSSLESDPTARGRFDREARAIAALNHPNICSLHDIGDVDGRAFLVMERLEGETLQQRLQRGPLAIDELLAHATALADALAAAHALGLIHRDLKPANVFITTRNIPKILDFGLAKSIVEPEADLTRSVDEALTVSGTTLGTLAYMSPEQLRAEPLDARTDLFSLGAVLYEMATGRRAFPGSTAAVVAASVLGQEPPPPRSVRPDLPLSIENAILKALRKDLASRCQSARELLDDVKGVTSPSSVMPSVTASAAQPRSRRLALVAALVLAAVVAGWSFSRWQAVEPDGEVTNATRPGTPRSGPPGGAPPPFDPRRDGGPGEMPPPGPGRAAPGPDAVAPPPPPREGGVGGRPGQPPPDRPAPPPPALAEGVPAPDPADESALANDGRRGRVRGRGARGLGAGAMTLIGTLSTVPPETYDLVFASKDPESRNLAMQLRAALAKAGWTNASTMEVAEPQARFGIFAAGPTPGVTALTGWATRSGMQPEIRRVPTLERPRIVIGRQPAEAPAP